MARLTKEEKNAKREAELFAEYSNIRESTVSTWNVRFANAIVEFSMLDDGYSVRKTKVSGLFEFNYSGNSWTNFFVPCEVPAYDNSVTISENLCRLNRAIGQLNNVENEVSAMYYEVKREAERIRIIKANALLKLNDEERTILGV